MDDLELGEALGTLNGQLIGIAKRLDDLQVSNSREHAANARQHAANAVRVEELREEVRTALDKKADKGEVEEVRGDVKKLNKRSDENQGRDSVVGKLILGSIGSAVTLLVATVTGHPVF